MQTAEKALDSASAAVARARAAGQGSRDECKAVGLEIKAVEKALDAAQAVDADVGLLDSLQKRLGSVKRDRAWLILKEGEGYDWLEQFDAYGSDKVSTSVST